MLSIKVGGNWTAYTFRLVQTELNSRSGQIRHYNPTWFYTGYGVFFIMIPTKEQNPKGLHQRYVVSKMSGEPIDAMAEYFILWLDSGGSDTKHIEACRKAVLKYAEEIKEHLPELSKDLVDKYSS